MDEVLQTIYIFYIYTHTYTYIMWIFKGSVYFLFEFILTEYIIRPLQLKIPGSATDRFGELLKIQTLWWHEISKLNIFLS